MRGYRKRESSRGPADLRNLIVWVRRSEGSLPASNQKKIRDQQRNTIRSERGYSPLKARDLIRPRIYMLSSLRFSGSTS